MMRLPRRCIAFAPKDFPTIHRGRALDVVFLQISIAMRLAPNTICRSTLQISEFSNLRISGKVSLERATTFSPLFPLSSLSSCLA